MGIASFVLAQPRGPLPIKPGSGSGSSSILINGVSVSSPDFIDGGGVTLGVAGSEITITSSGGSGINSNGGSGTNNTFAGDVVLPNYVSSVLITDSSGLIETAATTPTELGYLNGVTSLLTNQIASKTNRVDEITNNVGTTINMRSADGILWTTMSNTMFLSGDGLEVNSFLFKTMTPTNSGVENSVLIKTGDNAKWDTNVITAVDTNVFAVTSGTLSLNTNTYFASYTNGITQLTNGSAFVFCSFAQTTNIPSLVYMSDDGSLTTFGISNITAGTSFYVFSGNASDTNRIFWSWLVP